jgi:ATP-dependent DNA helicase RecG
MLSYPNLPDKVFLERRTPHKPRHCTNFDDLKTMEKVESLGTLLGRLQKPIRYAVQKNFAHIMKVRGLGAFVTQQVQKALERNPSIEETRSLAELEALFADYDQLPEGARQGRLQKAEGLLSRLSRCSSISSAGGRLPAEGEGAFRETVSWDRPVQYLKGVGPRRAEWFGRLGIRTLEDLLYFLPWRYEDRSRLKSVAELVPNQEQTVCVVVQSTHLTVTSRQRFRIFEMIAGDESGSIRVKWFNQPYLQKVFKNGQRVMLTGKTMVGRYGGRGLEIDNPVHEILDENNEAAGLHTGRIVPVYHETHGLTSRPIRSLVRHVLDEYADRLPEFLPTSISGPLRLLALGDALRLAHFPPGDASVERLNQGQSEAHRRLAFEELFLLQLGLGLKRRQVSDESPGISFRSDGRYLRRFLAGLPYDLTGDQSAVLAQIRRDMERPHPMNRLLQGDVGCGKTIVALSAMMIAVDNGYQAALMVPTEILAEQHYLTVLPFLKPFDLPCYLLTQGQPKRERSRVLKAVAERKPAFVIGTHALVQENIHFGRLGLVVVDEQHKFGVMQRARLQRKGYRPDVLIMTATPIPRTLALSVHGDLDLSVIHEMPKGRSPIETQLYYESKRPAVYSLLAREVADGRQAYIVYPIVEESEKTDLKAATRMAEHLRRDVFPSLNIGLLHGRMSMEEKEGAMGAFKNRQTQILVATTVIEVGIDVSNATVMVIEHAERFGLSQLHQLRGRVGRGSHRSYCVLMTSGRVSDEAKRRLGAMVRSLDGFVIAEEDLAIRGPGEFFGTRQSGLPELRVANILRDAELLEIARDETRKLLAADPFLVRPEHAALKEVLSRKWKEKLELFTVS